MVVINILFLCLMIAMNFYIGYLSRKKIIINDFIEEKLIKIEKFIKRNIKLVPVFFVLFSAFFYLWKLNVVPLGLNVDEAGSLYDAISLSKYGVDRYLYHFPVYFINYGGGQNALYTYFVVILFSLFGINLFIFRLPAALFGIVSILLFYILIKNEKDNKTAFLGTLIMLITPFFIMKSRWGLESYLFLPLLLISVFIFFNAINKNRKILFFCSGLLFGITLYTYAISYIIVPLLLMFSCSYLLYIKRVKLKDIIILFLPLFLLSIPLILMIFINKGIISNEIITNYFSIPKLWDYRGGEISLSNVKTNLLYIWKVLFILDGLVWNAFPNYFTLYLISVPSIVYGFILSFINSFNMIKKRKFGIDIIMILIFIIMFSFGLLIKDININKMNCIYISLVYFISLSLVNIFIISRRCLLIILLMYSFMFFNFIYYYFNVYPKDYKDTGLFVSNDYDKAIDFAQGIRKKNQYICADREVVQSYIYFLIHDKENPYVFNRDLVIVNNEIYSYKYYLFSFYVFNVNNIYITVNNSQLYDNLKKMNLNEKKFNNYIVFYK